jgi:hypothetical protein
VTTGEVLIPHFSVDGRGSGETVLLRESERPRLRAEISWTFPPRFAEIVSGDGRQVHRQQIDLSHAAAFGSQTLELDVDLRGRHWVRCEVWDIAANGAFTQPIWLARD